MKSCLDFGDIYLIDKVTILLRLQILSFFHTCHYLLSQWLDFNKPWNDKVFGERKDLIRFW